jgi:hypothetical protein
MAIIPADEKVFMVDKRTNTTYGGSQALQDMQQWYTMQDVADSVQPYKVFTALLTQSGGDDVQFIFSGELVIGVTYFINNNDGSGDFLNVGAPSNEQGTYFIATGTTPNSWGILGSVDLSYNTGAPVATVLENTIGNIWFERQGQGTYNCVSSGLFPEGKTFITISALGRPLIFAFRYFSDNQIQIQTITTEYSNEEWDNEFPGNFEIRVYN